jgi:hypothetical protein
MAQAHVDSGLGAPTRLTCGVTCDLSLHCFGRDAGDALASPIAKSGGAKLF